MPFFSGMAAAEHVATALAQGRSHDEISAYEEEWRAGPVGRDLRKVRNAKPLWSKFGTLGGIVLGGVEMWLTTFFGGWSPLGTMKHGKADHQATDPGSKHRPIAYPKPDGKLTFDRLSSVFLSNTNHEEDQPVHLRLEDEMLQHASELHDYGRAFKPLLPGRGV